jgi:hypothetical protein
MTTNCLQMPAKVSSGIFLLQGLLQAQIAATFADVQLLC